MDESFNTTIPRYLKIAVDIATRISSGKIMEGEKLKGRSVLSTEYNVSSETIRRALSLLSDKKVVVTKEGSGSTVLSKQKAIEFIHNFNSDDVLAQMQKNLYTLLTKRTKLDKEIAKASKHIADMYKYRKSDIIEPIEVIIPKESHVIKKSIGTLQIWHNTGATIMGIIRNKDVIISPGPYFEFEQDDKVLIVGDKHVAERFNAFVILQ